MYKYNMYRYQILIKNNEFIICPNNTKKIKNVQCRINKKKHHRLGFASEREADSREKQSFSVHDKLRLS
jgi:hypothetical protein